MKQFICIHGHFYQPPRENPWLEAIELQDSALPYHDWNERITAGCYAPNAYARFLNGNGKIESIVSNYSKISFNFGPTVLSWMRDKAADVYQAIVQADKDSLKRFSGHGAAVAQCYNHMIMPLANERDKRTQAQWGIRDFEATFGREPEGMWLPECAADNATLEILADFGIKYTILSPFQADQVRGIGDEAWSSVNGGKIDPSMPYLVKFPSGKSIAVFFYDAPVAQAVAFERLLTNGENFANRLKSAFVESRNRDQLVNIATDGESYGHHFEYGEMALAYALHSIESSPSCGLTVYGEYLAEHPPTHEVTIHQGSAWSCSHGVGRWQRDCGCNSGGYPGWNQAWREPLRNALDWLRDELAPRFESKAGEFFKDPWKARDEYLAVILNRAPENIAKFFEALARKELTEPEKLVAIRLLEMQRHAMLMYTSCGWFFDELSGIETVQVIQYAARALQLANDIFSENLEPAFLERLEKAKSNLPEHGNGRNIYEKFVKPAIITREIVGAHFAVSSLFESYPEEGRIYSFRVQQEDRQVFTAGNARLAIGRIRVTFEVTGLSDVFSYGVVHSGGHNLNCGVRPDGNEAEYAKMLAETREAFERGDFAELIRCMDANFGSSHYTLKNLFRDEQRKVLSEILASTHEEIRNTYRLITDRYATLMRFLADLHAPAPPALRMATEYVLNSELRRQFDSDKPDLERVRALIAECASSKVAFDSETLGYACKARVDRLTDLLMKSPNDLDLLQTTTATVMLLRELPFQANLWKAQNNYFALAQTIWPGMHGNSVEGVDTAREWEAQFLKLGEALGFEMKVPELPPEPIAESAEPEIAARKEEMQPELIPTA